MLSKHLPPCISSGRFRPSKATGVCTSDPSDPSDLEWKMDELLTGGPRLELVPLGHLLHNYGCLFQVAD